LYRYFHFMLLFSSFLYNLSSSFMPINLLHTFRSNWTCWLGPFNFLWFLFPLGFLRLFTLVFNIFNSFLRVLQFPTNIIGFLLIVSWIRFCIFGCQKVIAALHWRSCLSLYKVPFVQFNIGVVVYYFFDILGFLIGPISLGAA